VQRVVKVLRVSKALLDLKEQPVLGQPEQLVVKVLPDSLVHKEQPVFRVYLQVKAELVQQGQ
jgi:hypothetical protein